MAHFSAPSVYVSLGFWASKITLVGYDQLGADLQQETLWLSPNCGISFLIRSQRQSKPEHLDQAGGWGSNESNWGYLHHSIKKVQMTHITTRTQGGGCLFLVLKRSKISNKDSWRLSTNPSPNLGGKKHKIQGSCWKLQTTSGLLCHCVRSLCMSPLGPCLLLCSIPAEKQLFSLLQYRE